MNFLFLAAASTLMAVSTCKTLAEASPKWRLGQTTYVQLISNQAGGANQCESQYKACLRRIPSDYQGHPGREANWTSRCKAAQTKCHSQYGSATNAHWCSRGSLNSSEMTICKSSKLLTLDTKLHEAYMRATESIAVQGRAYERLPLFKKQQVAWIKKRDRCGSDMQCLVRIYDARLRQLAP